MKKEEHKIKIEGLADRDNVIVALTKNGYKVWVKDDSEVAWKNDEYIYYKSAS